MSTAGLYVLQKAIVALLKQSAALKTLVGNPPRVYDVPPPDATYPFIEVGMAEPKQWGARDITGFQGDFTVNCVSSDYRGSGLSKQIADAVCAQLDGQASSLTLDAGTAVLMQFSSSGPRQDGGDGVTWVEPVRFNIIYQKN